jgi:hypothetical protein
MPLLLAHALMLLQTGPVAELPIVLKGTKVHVKAIAAGKPLDVVVDTGASTSVIETKLVGDSGEGTPDPHFGSMHATSARPIPGYEIAFIGSSLKHKINVAMSLEKLAPFAGHRLEAIVGYDLFRNYVVEFDFENKKLRLWSPSSYAVPKVKPLPVRFQGNHPHIDGTVTLFGNSYPVDIKIDTGAGTGLSLTKRFVDSNSLGKSISKLPLITTGAGVDGPILGRRQRISGFEFAGNRIKSPVTHFTESGSAILGAEARFDALLGAEILHQFKLSVDYPGKKVYLEPNKSFGKPILGEKSGVILIATGPKLDGVKVYGLVPGSPAGGAGLKAGDRLLAIDGRDVSSRELWQWKSYLRTASKKVSLEVDRDGKRLSLSYMPKEMVSG